MLDERDPAQLQKQDASPKSPATLRSWHMNEQGGLPNPSGAVPQNALHTHYTQTSTHPYLSKKEMEEQKAKSTLKKPVTFGPIGFAEYTGCGMGDDVHNVKLVLDYTNHDVYVTVTHYQRWNKSKPPNVVYEIKSKSDGDHSAWFYIDFAQ